MSSNGNGPVRISFCSTCKNRLWQVRQTLRPNLDAIRKDGHAELILVNYNSQDELDAFVREFLPELEEGILQYVHERTEPYFHCSKAKNLAHFAASGDFVVNLDGDNFIGGTIPVFRKLWEQDENHLIQGFCGNFKDGTYGRIGMARRHFLALGGYDEEFLPVGHQDRDLIGRAKTYGLKFVRVKQEGTPAVRNTVIEKMKYTGLSLSHGEMVKINSARLDEGFRTGRTTVNRGRMPVKVLVNFKTEVEL